MDHFIFDQSASADDFKGIAYRKQPVQMTGNDRSNSRPFFPGCDDVVPRG